LTQELQPIINKIIEAGLQLTPEAFNHLQSMPSERLDKVIRGCLIAAETRPDLFIIDEEFLRGLEEPRQTRPALKPPVARLQSRIELLSDRESQPVGDVNGFIDYFNSRFRQLEAILKNRFDVRDAIPLSQAVKQPVKTKFKTIGLVAGKSTRSSRLFLDLEDSDTSVTVMVSGDEASRKGLEILNDQIICVDGLKYRDDLIIANDLIWPDVPMHDINRADENVCAVFVGDIHVGSKYFRADLFDKFIKWMNRDLGPPASRELAGLVKYLVVTGDLVDGIGIYPEQLDELTITTQKAQYEEAARLLSQLPEHVEILIIPGNHDAVRRSLPQPPISKKYAPALYMDPRIHLLPNPCNLSLHGVKAFIFHGKALDDILSSTPGYDFHSPVNGLELLMRCRHIAPIYGQSTPIAPEKVDRLVIDIVPDVVACGHIHIHEMRKYHGLTLICSGSFQDQTPFQRRMKLEPTPGVISVYNLMNHQHIPLDLERLN
jgi:DNA polymerase II small subunit